MLDTLPDDLFYHVCLQARGSCTSYEEYDALFSSPLMDVSSTFAARMVSEEYVSIVLTKEWKKNPEEHAAWMYYITHKSSLNMSVKRCALMHLTTVRLENNDYYWNIPSSALRSLPALHTLSYSFNDRMSDNYYYYAPLHQQELLRGLQGCVGLKNLTLQICDAMTTWDHDDPMLTLLSEAVMQMPLLTSLTFVGPSTYRNPCNYLPPLCALVLNHRRVFGTLQEVQMHHGLEVRTARALLADTTINVRLYEAV